MLCFAIAKSSESFTTGKAKGRSELKTVRLGDWKILLVTTEFVAWVVSEESCDTTDGG
jgi:hypothetical protein